MAFLLKHLATVHSSRPGFFFSCELNGCQRTFRNITTYKHHVYAAHSKHHTNLLLSTTGDPTNQSMERDDDNGNGSENGESENDNDTGQVDDSNQHSLDQGEAQTGNIHIEPN